MTGLTLPAGWQVYVNSIVRANHATYALANCKEGKFLYTEDEFPLAGGEVLGKGKCYPLTPETAMALQEVLPWLSPRRIPAGRPSFGFGDRLGLATPGHIRAFKNSDVFPMLAQQSVRENARTGRNFAEVLSQAVFGAFQEGYTDGFGTDADHLKMMEDAIEAAELGYTFFTCDPSDHVVIVEKLTADELMSRFSVLERADEWRAEYLGREFSIPGIGELRFTEAELARAAVKYGRAVGFASEMYRILSKRLPEGFDYEVSVDETETPTSRFEHLFVARELERAGVGLKSLAPRFVGAMEKGVDWRGDMDKFKEELRAHKAIAQRFGDYRLSLHSGSDKFSLYPVISAATDVWHVKTAGTSYLVALEVAARRNPRLFRNIAKLSLGHFAEDRATYHLSSDPDRIPPLDKLSDGELPGLVSMHDSRQVLHVGYGSVLRSPLGDQLKGLLAKYEDDYTIGLERHLGRHLQGLGVKK
jgi:hypothetical protein